MNEFYAVLLLAGLLLAVAAYLAARLLKIYAVVDLVWSLGLLFGAYLLALNEGVDHLRDWLVLTAVSVWSIRLSLHLLRDRILPQREDPRYMNLIERWKSKAPRNFLFLFFLQLPLVGLFLVPIGVALGNSTPFNIFDGMMVVLAMFALAGESLADHQLAVFRTEPSNMGKVCQAGLWHYSRHPNYFFEWLFWWVYVGWALGSAFMAWSLLGPLVMYIFLRYISGIPPAEYSSLKRRGAAYAAYQKSTSPFFPWKPREERQASLH